MIPAAIEPPLVEVRKAYRDCNSREESTGRIRDKFKLAGNFLLDLDIFPFFIINKSDSSLKKSLMISIFKKDWENRIPDQLHLAVSYIDISDIVPLCTLEILDRKNDPQNGFRPVATLCLNKFNVLQKKAKQLRNPRNSIQVSRDTRKLICMALDSPDELRRKLGL